MKEEYSQKVAFLVETGQRLMLATAEGLLCGNDPDIESWQQVLSTYEEIVSEWPTRLDTSEPVLAQAIGLLAHIMTASTLDTAIQLVAQIPKMPQEDLPRLLGRTVIAKRERELDPYQPTNQHDLGMLLFQLTPYIESLEKVTLGIQSIIKNLHNTLEPLIQQENFTIVIDLASLYVFLANKLADTFNLPIYMGNALEWGEQIIRGNTPPTASSKGIWALAGNLVKTYRWFARDHESDEQFYLEKAISMAHYSKDVLEIEIGSLGYKTYLRVFRSYIDALAAIHIRLGVITPTQFYTHAIEIWKTLQEYTSLAEQYSDHDLEAESLSLNQMFASLLWQHKPEWVWSSMFDQVSVGQLPRTLLYELFLEPDADSYQTQASMIVEQITYSSDFADQQKSIEAILDWWYVELNDLLLSIVLEVGLNYYVCRFLFVLGLMASGRVEALVSSSIPKWKWRMGEGDIPPEYNRETLYHQQLSPEKSLTQAGNLEKIITALSELTEALQQKPTLADTAHRLLREHNATLLRSLLSHGVHVQKLDNGVQTAIDDLVLLLKKIPKQARVAALDGYTKTDLSNPKEPTPIEPISPDGLLDVPAASLSPVPLNSSCLLPCGHEQRPNARFCSVCGTSIPS